MHKAGTGTTREHSASDSEEGTGGARVRYAMRQPSKWAHDTAYLPQMQGVVMLEPAIDGPSSDPDRLTVVKIVDVAASKRQGVVPSRKAKLLNLQGNLKGVFTGDPLSPRRFPVHPEFALFSITYVSIRYGPPVEAC